MYQSIVRTPFLNSSSKCLGLTSNPTGGSSLLSKIHSQTGLTPTAAHSSREVPPATALVSKLVAETPTVRRLHLKIDELDAAAFNFRVGQWVDFFIPGMHKVGGYSIISLPRDLPELQLAVKDSQHPPARWCFAEARVGDKVQLRVGGNFHLDHDLGPIFPVTKAIPEPNLLLIAGGIGINPLFAMFKYLAFQLDQHSAPPGRDPPTWRCHLLYSASLPEELAFRQEIECLVARHPGILTCDFTVTRLHANAMHSWEGGNGRIDEGVVHKAVQMLTRSSGDAPATQRRTLPSVVVCGPPQMTDSMVAKVLSAGVPETRIKFERWW
ncbi:hypothetical protein CYMTET_21269 [Cymbomonas tetramitiformis]|uniref:Oxidoreductase NAD-binding domain-containing protein 1 n=1 Tax=Cymbomonas tetramitiformis TaxID=36881 RepID=A0AAE0G360_9CHLO|nr:hypothetical protein CYMTET_21269 [Cymbomonas tetramitiformis]|eukprot:gene16210-biopygen16712